MSETPVITLRLGELATWATKHAKKNGVTRTGLIRGLLQALRERRLVILSAPVSFTPNDGTTQPVLVCLNPE